MYHIYIYKYNRSWRVAVHKDGREQVHKDCGDLSAAQCFTASTAEDFTNGNQAAPVTLIDDETSIY